MASPARGLAVLAVLAFLALASLGRGWLIDDAGISFAYARTIAEGHGPRPQPQGPAVEGFSNPLWVVLFTLLYALGLVTLPGTAKLVSLVLTVLAARWLWRAAAELGAPEGEWVAAGTLWFTATNIAVVHWTLSGLENPMTLALAMASLAGTLEVLRRPEDSPAAWRLALVGACLVWNRPDGVALALAPVATGACLALRERRWPPWLTPALVGPLVAGAALLGARYLLFGTLLPNTYLVKGGPRWEVLSGLLTGSEEAWRHARGLSIRLFGSAVSGPLLIATGLAALLQGARGRLERGHLALLMHLGAATAVYLLLPPDWMDETRFATAAYPLAYLAVLATWALTLADVPKDRRRRLVGGLVAVLTLAAIPEGYFRVLRTLGRANISIDFTARAFGRRFDHLADLVGIQEGVVALQDLGGTLLTTRLRVVDLAGLCDRNVARTLGHDRPALREYLFGEVRPDFLVLHGPWAEFIRGEEDPRLARDYVSIHTPSEANAADAQGHATGVYVRRDHVAGRPELLARLRAEEHRLEAFDREPDRGPVWDLLLAVPGLPRPVEETLTHPKLPEAPGLASPTEGPAAGASEGAPGEPGGDAG